MIENRPPLTREQKVIYGVVGGVMGAAVIAAIFLGLALAGVFNQSPVVVNLTPSVSVVTQTSPVSLL